MKKKFLALGLAFAMVVSMTACGEGETQVATVTATPTPGVVASVTATPTPTPTAAAVRANYVKPQAASVDFEDGSLSFVKMYLKQANASDATLEIATLDNSKALKVTRTNTTKVPFVAFDVKGLLGEAAAAKVAQVDFTIATEHADGKFYPTEGNVTAWYTDADGNRVENNLDGGWSVYLANRNPKNITYTVPKGCSFGTDGTFMITLTGDVDPAASATFYIDDICFIDDKGVVLRADTSVAFTDPVGFENTGHDNNLLYVNNETVLDGFAVSAGGWAQAGIDLTDEQRALIKPGSVITISYKCADPVWMVAIGDNPKGGWLRGIDQGTFVPKAYVGADGGTIQYTYEQLVEFWGEGFESHISTLQCEGKSDWEVYEVKVGTASEFGGFSEKLEIPGMAVSAGGWAQAGVELTDEIRALIKPGCVFQVEYKCDAPVWFVAIGDNPKGGWLRAIDQSKFETCGSVGPEGGVVQYTYEQLAEFWGDGFEQYLGTLQCEGKADWEVYSVKIGKVIKPSYNNTAIDGMAVSAGGWAQAGTELSADIKALIKPGCVFNVSYKCDSPVWFVAIGDNPLGGWLRAIDQGTFETCGAVDAENGMVQYTYEELVQFWGEGFEQYFGTLQCEGKANWEVYSVVIGQTK